MGRTRQGGGLMLATLVGVVLVYGGTTATAEQAARSTQSVHVGSLSEVGNLTAPARPGVRCHRWRVKWRRAAVYEKPARIYSKVAVKRRGQVVTGAHCGRLTYYNKREGVRYLAVKARRAEDKIGWIRLAAVRHI